MGGKEGSRGYVYQGIVAVLESFSLSSWDKIYSSRSENRNRDTSIVVCKYFWDAEVPPMAKYGHSIIVRLF